MKKLLIVFALMAVIVALVACGDEPVTSDITTTTTTAPGSNVSIETDKDYTAVVDAAYADAVAAGSNLGDLAKEYEFFGNARDVAVKISTKYASPRVWYVLKEDGTKEETPYTEINKMGVVGAAVVKNAEGKHEITVKKMDIQVIPKYESLKAKTGSYIMFDFYANMPATFTVSVTTTEGGSLSGALYKETQIPTEEQKNGAVIGLAKFTVPHTVGKTYYLNIHVGTTVVASVPIEAVQGDYATNICQLWMTGCWERVKDPDYIDNIIYEFYSCYPQILARFGVMKNEPTAITVYIEDTDGVAWAAGTEIGIGLGWVNEKTHHELSEIGFLSHELGHSAQQFAGKLNYGEDTTYDLNGDGKIDYKGEQVDGDEEWEAWFTEQMASYAGLRYYHWGTLPEAVDLEKLTPEHNYNFNWSGYGNCGVFFAYVDWHYPTLDKNGNGKVDDGERGVIDALYWEIKNTKKMIFDNPYDPDIIFNQTIQEATGGKYKNFPEIYEDFVADMKSGEWVFTGFADYPDNWLSENIPGIENPKYPVYKPVTPGNVTNEAILQSGVKADTAVLPEGENVATGATVIQYSGKHADDEGVEALLDGKLDTYWRAMGSEQSALYKLMTLQHGFIIDLGSVKSFDTYAIVNAGITKPDSTNTYEWEILVSEDGETFTSIDYQKNKAADVVTVDVGTQSARYIEVRIHQTNLSSSGTVWIYEMAFLKTK